MYIIFTVQYIAYGRCTMEINYLHFRLSPAVIGYVEEKTPTIHFLLVSYMIKYANPKKKQKFPMLQFLKQLIVTFSGFL